MSVKRLSIMTSSSTSGSISNEMNALYNDYIRNYARLLMFQNGWNAGVPNGPHVLYKHIETINKTNRYSNVTYKSIDKSVKRKADLAAYVIELGGSFEKIGEEDESIGGDYQKVG